MQWWKRPVHVAVIAGTSVAVTSNERAAELLLYEWLGGGTDRAHFARSAFEAAADEAGILMDEPPKSLAPASFKSPSWRKRKR